MFDGIINAINAIIDGIQTVVDFLAFIASAFVDLIVYIGEATALVLSLGGALPAPIVALITGYSAIMIIYSIKGS